MVAGIRGRLDALEALLRTAPALPALSPRGFDEPGIEALTPPSYLSVPEHGLPQPLRLSRYDAAALQCVQVGAAEDGLEFTPEGPS
jgi:hypothetical protein